jgi:hypothetical protein
MIVTPVSASPLRMAHWIGAAPRYLGSRDVWTLRQPKRGRSRMLWGRIWPYAATTIRSGCKSRGRQEGFAPRPFGLEDGQLGLQAQAL